MPINFIAAGSSAFDQESGVFIPAPRMEPISLPDGTTGIEFQYSFLLRGEFIGALALRSTRSFIEGDGSGAWVIEIDFTDDSEISAALRLKCRFRGAGDDYAFLCTIARGVISVFAGFNDNVDAQSTSVFTTAEALTRNGVLVPPEVLPAADDRIVLAEVLVPAQPLSCMDGWRSNGE